MARTANISPLGLYQWDQSIFDLMQIPSALDKPTLIDNLLAETAELEVLYPNPVVFKNLVGVWSVKNLDVWNRLYATTQYDYNPIENYNRYETGEDSGTGSTTHSGTDTTTGTTTHGGTDTRTESITLGGKDTLNMTRAEGGTETKETDTSVADGGTERENTTTSLTQGGSDTVTGTDEKGHWIAGFNSTASGSDDGLVKQSRDEDEAQTTTAYGKTESGTGTKTTTFGKTTDTDTTESTTFGKTETNKDETVYGKTENVSEQMAHGETITTTGGLTHGEQVATTNEGEHSMHAHGNIGVTTTQKLIREQREIELFNLYDIIIEDFKMRFCILVY